VLLSLGCSTATPWHTPRELSEEEIERRLESALRDWDGSPRLILNVHVPPYDSGIDMAPQVTSDLEVEYRLGTPVFAPAGSRAVRRLVEQRQPLLGLFGHVHEAQGMIRLGRTVCLNPGSSFSEGLLKGCIITIEEDQVSCQFTTG